MYANWLGLMNIYEFALLKSKMKTPVRLAHELASINCED